MLTHAASEEVGSPEASDDLLLIAAAVSQDAVFGLDVTGSVCGWSEGARRLFGYDAEEIVGQRAATVLLPGLNAILLSESVRRAIAGETVRCGRVPGRARGGRPVPVSLTLAPAGRDLVCAVARDISEVVATDTALDDTLGTLRHQAELFEVVHDVTAAATQSSDFGEALYRCLLDICHRLQWDVGHLLTLDRSEVLEEVWYLRDKQRFGSVRQTDAGKLSTVDEVVRRREPVWVTAVPPAEAPGLSTGFGFPVTVGDEVLAVIEIFSAEMRPQDDQLLSAVEIARAQLGRLVEQERARDFARHQSMHDALTGLPNRTHFMERLSEAVRGMGEGTGDVAVMFLDLDHFKLINDSLGHDVGDEVLQAVAGRIRAAVRRNDTAARFGGDEFILLLEGVAGEKAASERAAALLQALSKPIHLRGDSTTVVTVSIGIALAATAEVRPETLVRDADAAMYRAKAEGRDRFQLFDPALHEQARRKLSIANELRQALTNGELRLVYQPQYRISDRRLLGVEALVRWDNPSRGTLGPAEWIPVAEETQMIVPIGEWIVGEACRAAAAWTRLAPDTDGGFKVGVNVSAVQLGRPELVDAVVRALDTTGLDPGSLCLEITESVLMGSPGTYLEALLGLRLLGVSLAVDDFGTGYSSLAYLRRFPIDVIKIDKGFIDGLRNDDSRGRSIVKAVVQLASALGVTPVAEGVERADQVEALRATGCYAAQGFYYSRPVAAEDITAMLLGPAQAEPLSS